MTHRDRAGDAAGHRAGRREAAGDAGLIPRRTSASPALKKSNAEDAGEGGCAVIPCDFAGGRLRRYLLSRNTACSPNRLAKNTKEPIRRIVPL